MKQMKRLLGVGLLVLLCAGLGLAQPEVGIVVEAWSPQEIHDLGWESHPSTGLTTVGVGELVYLFAEADTVVAVAWSITTAPTGSAAVLDSTDTQRTTFRPDIVGDYVVQASITTDTGTADATVTITASTYVGVGIWTELQGNPGGSSCSPCHTGNVSQWLETGHPTIFKDGIDGIASSHYSEACIECHTLGYNTEPEAINNGFDDIATDLGWQFPDVLQVGNWDSLVTNFPDLAVMGSIQCENCHGPASEHTIGFDAAKMDVTLDEGMCGRCHEEEPYHRKNTQWKRSGHSAGDVAFGAGRADCAPCHSGYGFVNRIDPDMPFDEGLGFPYISCAVCHDPHSAGLAAQVRTLDNVVLNNGETITFGGMGKLCMSCHLSRRDAETYTDEYHDHYGPHHSTQADVLAGTNAITFGMYIPSTNHKGVIENACVDCHMAATPATGEPGRDWLGEHAFAMTWDAGTPEDETDDVEHVAGCQSCHGAISSFDDIMAKVDYDQDGTIEAARAELLGLLDEVGKLLPPLGDPHVEVVPEDYDPTEAGLTAEEVAQRQLYLKAAYNYFVVEEDGSHGLHNYQYAIHLLLAAHQALTTGSVAAGDILAIEDVPNDQGKQVRVQWTRFGADGAGQNPIVHYALWRRVDAANSTSATTVKGAAQVHMVAGDVQKLQTGSQLQFDGKLWDFAGTVPAAGLENYSAIAPTIFDSTIVSGMAYSVFMVTGHTAIPAVYAVSEPDSGYSVDNLVPTTPSNASVMATNEGATLNWDPAIDPDFNYFAVYRSTTPGFDPSTVEPLAEVTEAGYLDQNVTVGETYYYRLAAFDFSGNQSEYSAELSAVITSILDGSGEIIPDNYVLEQNYPNPFNPTTTIKFGLKESGRVTVTIFNSRGELVMQLFDGELAAGFHRVTMDAAHLSSGVYFYQIRVNNFSTAKKMVLMK